MAMKFLYVCDWCSEENSSTEADADVEAADAWTQNVPDGWESDVIIGEEGPFLICADCNDELDEAMAAVMKDRMGVVVDERTFGSTEAERQGG